jgi:hypothetical protein
MSDRFERPGQTPEGGEGLGQTPRSGALVADEVTGALVDSRTASLLAVLRDSDRPTFQGVKRERRRR